MVLVENRTFWKCSEKGKINVGECLQSSMEAEAHLVQKYRIRNQDLGSGPGFETHYITLG